MSYRYRALAGFVCTALVVFGAWVGSRWLRYQREATLREGIHEWETGNYKSALEKVTPFAKSGNWIAQVIMADMYAYGTGVPLDEVRAAIWFRSAECLAPKSSVGDFPGSREYYVGMGYLTGDTPVRHPDKALALRWIVRAAEAGNPDAQKLLSDDGMQRVKGLTPVPTLTEYWRRFISESQR